MQLKTTKITVGQLQGLVWLLVFFMVFCMLLPERGFQLSLVLTTMNIIFYSVIIYGNIYFLFPYLYEKNKRISYVIYSILFIIISAFSRGFLASYVYNTYFSASPKPFSWYTMVSLIAGAFLDFMLSFIVKIALAYFNLKKKSEEILLQKSQAELNLLKSQVQPHFLFNTLNNIYYEVYREAPKSAELIERLSEIMRYFVDESPKEVVSLNTEIHFLENYIELERIRIRHHIEINFIKQYNKELRLPPMLLMTFVENLFKHGIDKSSSINKIEISLIHQDAQLLFQTVNRAQPNCHSTQNRGFGLQNLRKRLNILFGENFELNADKSNSFFTAFLKIPLS